jgi:hypothetical protein
MLYYHRMSFETFNNLVLKLMSFFVILTYMNHVKQKICNNYVIQVFSWHS